MIEYFILTLFLCPPDVTKCTHEELIPAKTIPFEVFKDCDGVGQALVANKEYDDHACRRHEK